MSLPLEPVEILGAAQRLIAQVHSALDRPPEEIDVSELLRALERAMVRLTELQPDLFDSEAEDNPLKQWLGHRQS